MEGVPMEEKLEHLIGSIQKYRSAVIAFSGGVDSTLLAHVAGQVLGKNILLVTASSSTFPPAELKAAKLLAAKLGLPHRVIVSEETAIAGFTDNTPDRCYLCKRSLFLKIADIAEKEGYDAVFDGSNADDAEDYRPGRKALMELGILSPLSEARLTKKEIRLLSVERGLPTADKPSYACLASRFPYGEKITADKLRRVGAAESALQKLGFRQLRVRSHGDCARIEIAAAEIETAWKKRTAIGKACKKAGFVFVAIDTEGYRTGAMNEALGTKTNAS
jgi:pyridinium-3,5-biscarboxylic acid mononucleotide sulfurtransferase